MVKCRKGYSKKYGKCVSKYSFQNLKYTLYGSKITSFEIIASTISLTAATITVLQNMAPRSSLSISISSFTKAPTSLFMFFVGILLFVGTIAYLKKRRGDSNGQVQTSL